MGILDGLKSGLKSGLDSITRDIKNSFNETLAEAGRSVKKALNPFGNKTTAASRQNYGESARTKYEAGDYAGAVADYTKARKIAPTDYFFERGCAYFGLEDWEHAIADFTEGINWFTDCEREGLGWRFALHGRIFLDWRATAYLKSEDWEKAIADYTRAIELDSAVARYFGAEGVAYAGLQDWKKAYVEFVMKFPAVGLSLPALNDDGAGYFGGRGDAYFGLKDWRNAIADYTRAIELNSTRALYFCNRGKAYLETGEPQKAYADFERAVELDPENAEFRAKQEEAGASASKCSSCGAVLDVDAAFCGDCGAKVK
jgi:tetratricopeptide (TPR) repeat protein